MPDSSDYDVFLSYSDKDRQWVDEFTNTLRESGLSTWFDAKKIRPGERWRDRLSEALLVSRTLIFVISSDSARSPWTFFELGAALADDKRIIPVLIGGVEPGDLPPALSQYQAIREASPQEAGLRVIDSLASSSADSLSIGAASP